MRNILPVALGTLLCCFVFIPALACVWDHDTLQMERQRFPSALEAIAGKFLRHSKEFYAWRAQDRIKKLAAQPDRLEWYDDLAVAQSKNGDHAKAIETMSRKEAIKPGLYETASNLGTFQFFNGQLDDSIVTIGRALSINPDAHFGREVYQKLLFEYLREKQVDGKFPLPLHTAERSVRGSSEGFAAYIRLRRFGASYTTEADREEMHRATKGVLGMMTFADHTQPILLEVLGDLLLANWEDDAKQLAARAYLKASYEVKDEKAREGYRSKVKMALIEQERVSTHDEAGEKHEIVEKQFRRELDEGERWYAAVYADEQRWIAEGVDVDAEFAKKYYILPEVSPATRVGVPPHYVIYSLATLGVLLAGGLAFAMIYFARRSRAA